MNVSRTRVQEVLAEEGFEHDAALVAALERIAALRPAEAPAPSGELARLLAAAAPERTTARLAVVRELPATRAARKAEEAAAAATSPRWIKRHRGAMIGVLVAAGMGLGASGVAAMTGQAWEWQIAIPPAVSPSVVHGGKPAEPQVTSAPAVPADTAVGGAGLSQRGAAAPGAAGAQDRRADPGDRGAGNQGSAPAQGKDAQGAGADRQSGASSGTGRSQGSHGTQRQGAQPSSSPSASAGDSQGAGGLGWGALGWGGLGWGGQNGQSPDR